MIQVYQSFSTINIQFFFTESTIITVLRESVCMFYNLYQRVWKAKYVILIITLDMTCATSRTSNVDFKSEQNKNILRLIHDKK